MCKSLTNSLPFPIPYLMSLTLVNTLFWIDHWYKENDAQFFSLSTNKWDKWTYPMIESLVIIVSAATGSGDCWRIIGSQVPVIISLLFAELFTTPTPHCTLDHPCQGYIVRDTHAWMDLDRGQRSILDWYFMLSICSLRLSLSMMLVTVFCCCWWICHWHPATGQPGPARHQLTRTAT